MSESTAYVHIELADQVRPVGRLWSARNGGRERASFEFDRSWLKDPLHYALAPAFPATGAALHTNDGRGLFGALGDSAPDKWGRRLMALSEIVRSRAQDSEPRIMGEIEFLLGLTDETRQGALRFRLTPEGPFVAPAAAVPPLAELPALLAAANALESDADLVDVADAVRLLTLSGSSLGGSSPKAAVRDRDGALATAKFPRAGDTGDVVAWEKVMLTLASRSGIRVPDSRLEPAGDSQVLIVRRFDRRGSERIPFLSAMSLLDTREEERASYVEIFDELRRVASQPGKDARELWTRLAFNIMASNFDDHLRNHAVLYDGRGWTLSPAYDLNPVPAHVKARYLTTPVNVDGDASASMELALEAAGEFLLNAKEARAIAGEVARVVETWRFVASRFGITEAGVDAMASAFEHAEVQRALRW